MSLWVSDWEISQRRRRASSLRSERLAAARSMGTHTVKEWTAMVDVFRCCVSCGRGLSDLHGGMPCRDHIIPIYAGGCDCIANIQPLCRQCNSSKGADDTDHRPRVRLDWVRAFLDRLHNGWAV